MSINCRFNLVNSKLKGKMEDKEYVREELVTGTADNGVTKKVMKEGDGESP